MTILWLEWFRVGGKEQASKSRSSDHIAMDRKQHQREQAPDTETIEEKRNCRLYELEQTAVNFAVNRIFMAVYMLNVSRVRM